MSEFQNIQGIGGFDYFVAGSKPRVVPVASSQRNTLRVYDQRGDPPNRGRFEIIVRDFSLMGNNHPEGDFSLHSNGYSWSSMMTAVPGELTPAPTDRALGRPLTPTSGLTGVHYATQFGRFFIGGGSVSGTGLRIEDVVGGSIPDITSITSFAPASDICSVTATVASGAQRLAVGTTGNPVVLLHDVSASVTTTMHTDTNSCWGIILSGINATTAGVPVMLMYCGTSIKTKATDASMTTALVATVPPTTVNAGGRAVGAVKAAGRAQRAYWLIPPYSNTNGSLKFGAEDLMFLWSTDMTGSDLTPQAMRFLPNGMYQAEPFKDGILMHDGRSVIYWDGEEEWDLSMLAKRSQLAQSTNVLTGGDARVVRQVFHNGAECGAIWQTYVRDGTATGHLVAEIYRFEAGSWHNVSQHIATGTNTADVSIPLSVGSPISPYSRFLYFFDSLVTNDVLHTTYIPPAAESYYWRHNEGSTSTSSALPNYATSSLLGCRWWLDASPPGELPGSRTIRRAPKAITEVEFGGNLDPGGSAGWTFNVKVQGRGIDGTTTLTAYDQTFNQGQNSAHYIRANPVSSWANIQDVQLYLTVTAAGTTKKIPNLLPITIRGMYSKDGSVVKP